MNVYLHAFDRFVMSRSSSFYYLRYADNFLIGTKGSVEDSNRLIAEINDFLESTLELEIKGRDRKKELFLGYVLSIKSGRFQYDAPIKAITRKIRNWKSDRDVVMKRACKEAVERQLEMKSAAEYYKNCRNKQAALLQKRPL